MNVVPLHISNVFRIVLDTVTNPASLSKFARNAAKDLPKQTLQLTVAVGKNAWNATTESLSKHLRLISNTSSEPVITPRTPDEISNLQEEITNLSTRFERHMSLIEVKKDFVVEKLNLSPEALEKLKALIEKIKSQHKPTLGDLLDAEKTNVSPQCLYQHKLRNCP